MFLVISISLILSKLIDNNIIFILSILTLLILKACAVDDYKFCINYSRDMMKYTSILNLFELIGTILICIGINEVPINEYNIISILFLVFGTIIPYFFIFLNYDQTIYMGLIRKQK